MARKNILNRAVESPVTSPPVTDLPVTDPLPSPVTVRAVHWLGENGVTYKPGDTFQTSLERALALGHNVEIVKA